MKAVSVFQGADKCTRWPNLYLEDKTENIQYSCKTRISCSQKEKKKQTNEQKLWTYFLDSNL